MKSVRDVAMIRHYAKALANDVAFAFSARALLLTVAASVAVFALLGLAGHNAVTYAYSDNPQKRIAKLRTRLVN